MADPIHDFLAVSRIAVVGVSKHPKDFSRMVFRAFRERGYDVVPVNPNAAEIEGVACDTRVQDIQPPVEGALLLTSPAVSEQVVKDCVAAGIRSVWIYRRSRAAVAYCEANGVAVVAGECPMMYVSRPGFIHSFHGWLHGLRQHPVAS